ncbi:hypothetical protein [uncultured Erythrobacter sp.]|uniref:hypothetical protein n=1 Tax=uncultured Erythrobacter sp. TaxID=263913 RepID=UPI00261FE59E|nr:hypothetical protein [uncultured Erythrobacter sp.]
MSEGENLSKKHLRKRLSSYWKMEVGNALLLPAFMVFACSSLDQPMSWWLAFACLPMCGLLVLGGLYWRAKLHQLGGQSETLKSFLPMADKWQVPLAALSALAVAVAAGAWLLDLGASTGDTVCITVAAVLAGLEYINYYHRQLQHFDHPADFKRLMSGRGFARAQMAVDLAKFRRKS